MGILRGKVALVTGGNRGIGEAITRRLAAEGARVAFTYRTGETEADALGQQLRFAGHEVLWFQGDVRDRTRIHSVIQAVVCEWDGLDVLVNNAGINMPTDFDQITDRDWDTVLAVNLKGPFICSQEALSFMKDRRTGSIIFIGSVSAQIGGPRTAHYAASKAGLAAMAQVVARFGAPFGIRSNTVAAGYIESKMVGQAEGAKSVSTVIDGIPLGRKGTPDEVASAVVFLASDEASYITGQNINVNGGLYF